MPARDATDTVQFKLRLREKLRLKLEESSIFNDTSINTEILDRLEESFEAPVRFIDSVGGQEFAPFVRAVNDAMRSVVSKSADDGSTASDVERRLCAALVGIAQGVSGHRAESLLRLVSIDEVWRGSAAQAVARRTDIHPFVAEVIVVNPENEQAIAQAEKAAQSFKKPTIHDLLK